LGAPANAADSIRTLKWLSRRVATRVTGMTVGIVLDFQARGREGRGQLVLDGIEYGAHRLYVQFLKGSFV
jgi:hypothetical protein